eukprot:UN14602
MTPPLSSRSAVSNFGSNPVEQLGSMASASNCTPTVARHPSRCRWARGTKKWQRSSSSICSAVGGGAEHPSRRSSLILIVRHRAFRGLPRSSSYRRREKFYPS